MADFLKNARNSTVDIKNRGKIIHDGNSGIECEGVELDDGLGDDDCIEVGVGVDGRVDEGEAVGISVGLIEGTMLGAIVKLISHEPCTT